MKKWIIIIGLAALAWYMLRKPIAALAAKYGSGLAGIEGAAEQGYLTYNKFFRIDSTFWRPLLNFFPVSGTNTQPAGAPISFSDAIQG